MHAPIEQEWTLMFYFASDNALAPGIVSQLKSIKNAGYHPQVNVIAQFDPQTEGTPTHIFDVNHIEKLKRPGVADIGFASDDPFVRNLLDDKLWRDQRGRDEKPIREGMKQMLTRKGVENYRPPVPPNDRNVDGSGRHPAKELDPRVSLWNFLKFCRDYYPAKHYVLFILGHGVVVGNDIFLLDEHADEQSLSLVELGKILNRFKQEIADFGAVFELVSFNSCSVSSLEIAYELKGTARYMLAAQGPAFVGSWPYRQILIRIFNDVARHGPKIDIEEMFHDIFYYCMHNSTDFLLAGYSFDLCLCSLENVTDIKEPLTALSESLIVGLENPLLRDLILLAHWKSQSYWQESYTDLYDFCLCLSDSLELYGKGGAVGPVTLERIRDIRRACWQIMDTLRKKRRENRRERRIIIASEFAGPACQYSHGLSVYFPWSRPVSDTPIMEDYESYKINQLDKQGPDGRPVKVASWYDFLDKYFEKTMRKTRKDEAKEDDNERRQLTTDEAKLSDEKLFEDRVCLVYTAEGRLSAEFALAKLTPRDLTGDESLPLSVKNHPHDTRARHEKAQQAAKEEEGTTISPTMCSMSGNHSG